MQAPTPWEPKKVGPSQVMEGKVIEKLTRFTAKQAKQSK